MVEQPVVFALAAGTLLIDLALIAGLTAWVLKKAGIELELEKTRKFLSHYVDELSLLLVLTATSGSLYLSNFLGYTPCRLCWFQRILMYPLVIILAIGLFLKKDDISDYVLPFTLIGVPLAFYHYVIQRVDQFKSAGCSVLEVSCSTEYTFYFDYITIPMMALTAFLGILVLQYYFRES